MRWKNDGLIDADRLLKFFTVDTANQTYRFGTVKKQIESAPTVKAISLDQIKSLRDDAIEYRDDEENDFVDFEVGAINGVIALSDKLIAESEDL